MVKIGEPHVTAQPCRSCGENFLWGYRIPGGWMPLDPMPYPTGPFAFAPIEGKACLLRTSGLPRFDELPLQTRALIHRDGLDELFRRALDAPRYRPHPKSCSIEVVQSMRYNVKDLIQELCAVGLAPFITEGDVFFHD